nr:hypothetical protein [Neorhizobium tomejilense]
MKTPPSDVPGLGAGLFLFAELYLAALLVLVAAVALAAYFIGRTERKRALSGER